MTDAERQRLARALAEQGLAGDEAADLLPDVQRLVAWAPEAPRPEETRRLLAALSPHVPARRPALRAEFERLVALALTQATVLRLGFWTGSAAVMLVGVALLLAAPDLSRSLVFLLAGPLLAYLGTAAGFRGESLRVLEVEFACPVTPRQLTVARLLVIVGYQAAVGTALTAVLSTAGGASWLAMTLLWLAPMLVGTGATLLGSLRAGVARAGALVYAAWILVAVTSWRVGLGWIASPAAELGLVALGLALTAAAVALLPAAVPRALGRAGRTF
ncbi:MAG TPA: hypothetical protein VGO86_16270 [Candidatus Dormibacteraeota bacterium]